MSAARLGAAGRGIRLRWLLIGAGLAFPPGGMNKFF